MRRGGIAVVLGSIVAVLSAGCGGSTGGAGDAASSSAAAPSDDTVVGYLNDDPILHEEAHGLIAADLAQFEQQVYELKRRAVQQIALNRILDELAAERGISREEMVRQDVVAQMPEITEDALRQAFEANKARDPQLASRSFEEARDYVESQVTRQVTASVRDQYLSRLVQDHEIKVTLEPPRDTVPIPDYEARKGDPDAPITIVEFADYECGYCRRFAPEMERILDEYGEHVQFVFRDYPLEFHAKAIPAAVAAHCAGEQDEYWAYHDDLMTNVNAGNLERQDLIDRADKLGLEVAEFTTCIDADRFKDRVDRGFEDGKKLGVSGTPTIFVNGRRLIGYKNYAQLKVVMDEELEFLGIETASASADEGEAGAPAALPLDDDQGDSGSG